MRLKALEAKETSTQSELKKLADAKKAPAEKPKFPNVAISGVFQADAVTFNQLESSREAYAGRLIEQLTLSFLLRAMEGISSIQIRHHISSHYKGLESERQAKLAILVF